MKHLTQSSLWRAEPLVAGGVAAVALGGLGALLALLGEAQGGFLIAPFGASAVLLFAVPNSPMAQPWPVLAGNTLAALIGVGSCLWLPDPISRAMVALGLTIALTFWLRAPHPPAGAVALFAALSPAMVARLGFGFALVPVLLGSLCLVAFSKSINVLRKPQSPTKPPIGLSPEDLETILEQFRHSLNLSGEDLGQLIAAAELRATAQRHGPLTAADIMSRKLITVRPSTPLAQVAALFEQHRFTSLPVTEADGRYLGVIFQIHLISRAKSDATRLNRGLSQVMQRLISAQNSATAADIMSAAMPRATSATPLAVLLTILAQSGMDAVPVLDYGQLVGIVTQTDLLAALARPR